MLDFLFYERGDMLSCVKTLKCNTIELSISRDELVHQQETSIITPRFVRLTLLWRQGTVLPFPTKMVVVKISMEHTIVVYLPTVPSRFSERIGKRGDEEFPS